MPDPQAGLARLMDRLKPGSGRHVAPQGKPQDGPQDGWIPPAFERYEDIRAWLKESVLEAHLYERYPDGRWTIQLLLKEQVPGTYRYIVL